MTDELRELIERLEPCPFCGSEAKMHFDGGSSAWVSCDNRECFVQPTASTSSSKSGAAIVWNTRDQSLSERNAELEGALKKIEACCEYEYGSTGPRSTIARAVLTKGGK